MNLAVWDTYVKKPDQSIMHFDILVPDIIKDAEEIFAYGKAYLASKGLEGVVLSSNECNFCHVEKVRPQWEAELFKKGYVIIELENCND